MRWDDLVSIRDADHRWTRNFGDGSTDPDVVGTRQDVGSPIYCFVPVRIPLADVDRPHPVGHAHRQNARTLVVGRWSTDGLLAHGFGAMGGRDSNRQTLAPQCRSLHPRRSHADFDFRESDSRSRRTYCTIGCD